MKHGKSNIDILKDYVAGVRPYIKTGYTGDKDKHRAEGEVWKDRDGIEWQKKEGRIIRLTKTQGDMIREMTKQVCKCGQDVAWGSKLDKYFFARTGLCENCLITYETNLRILGIHGYYERYKMISYDFGILEDIKRKLEDTVKFFSEKDSGDIKMLCNSEGFIERWQGANSEKILEDAKKDLKTAKKRITEMRKILKEAKKLYVDSVKKYKLEAYV